MERTSQAKKREAAELENLIDMYYLIFNNQPGKVNKPTSGQLISIIELIFSTHESGKFDFCIIEQELATLSNHELKVIDLVNLKHKIGCMVTSQEDTEQTMKSMLES